MNSWCLFFQPHVSEWHMVRMQKLLQDYIVRNEQLKRGDISYLFAGSYGFCGWGFVKEVKHSQDDKTFVELSFVSIRENLVSEAKVNDYPQILDLRKRVEGNLVKLTRSDIKGLNRILEDNNCSAPELQLRLGKFGVKDDETLNEDLEEAIAAFGKASVAFADLDNFKKVNDNFDHTIGDLAIKSALAVVNERIASKGDLYHRSGDEMVVLLPNVGKAEAVELCETMRIGIETNEFDEVGSGTLTTTIGIATFPEDGDNGVELIRKADQRAMKGKSVSKNAVYSI